MINGSSLHFALRYHLKTFNMVFAYSNDDGKDFLCFTLTLTVKKPRERNKLNSGKTEKNYFVG